MNKVILAVGLSMMAGFVVAEEPAPKKEQQKLTVEQRIAMRDKILMEKHGGLIPAKGTPQGSVIAVNSQKKVASENFSLAKNESCALFAGVLKVMDGEAATPANAADLLKKYKADFAVFIVDDKSLPPSLVAVEAHWAIMNVAGLEPGAATPEMLRIRARNEFVRVFTLLCGGLSSQFGVPLTNRIKTVNDLDNCLPTLPVDISTRIKQYLDFCGVKPEMKVPYRKACMEGWAPQPTNEFQKAVWDEVHALPTKPLKLEK